MDTKRAQEIVRGFSGKRLLVVGDIVLDRYVFGNVERLNPEAPVPILHAQTEEEATGAAGNTAKNASMLGATTQLVTVVGHDATAKHVMKAAENEGYTVRTALDDSRPTIQKIRYYVHSQQMLRVDYEQTEDVESDVEDRLIELINESGEVDGILVSDYAKGSITQRVAEAIMEFSKKHDLPVMVDAKPSRIAFFTGAAYMSPNLKEAHEYLGLNQFDSPRHTFEELASGLRETFDMNVFLTLSDQGIYVLNKEGESAHVTQEHKVEVADTSGAGDSAAVVIMLAKLAGASDSEAAELGNAAGAVIVSKVGAVGLTTDELIGMVTHSHE